MQSNELAPRPGRLQRLSASCRRKPALRTFPSTHPILFELGGCWSFLNLVAASTRLGAPFVHLSVLRCYHCSVHIAFFP